MTRLAIALVSVALAGLGAADAAARTASPATAQNASPGDRVTTPSGLQYVDVQIGTGATAEKGQVVRVHYTGRLKDGTKFDSSLDRNDPIRFTLGVGQVIKGWDEGIAGMKVGGKRTLTIPADLAYGARGAGGVIPPDAELTFDVELVSVGP